MKVLLDGDDLKEFTSYKFVLVEETFYVWEIDWGCRSHRDIAEEYAGDLKKVQGAGSFTFKCGQLHFRGADYYSTSLQGTPAQNHVSETDIERLAKEFNTVVADRW